MITIDLDTKDKDRLRETYGKAKRYGKVSVAETAKGYHLRIESDIEDPWEIWGTRLLLGDDLKRLKHDKILIEMGFPELANRLFEIKKMNGKYVREKPVKMEE